MLVFCNIVFFNPIIFDKTNKKETCIQYHFFARIFISYNVSHKPVKIIYIFIKTIYIYL